VASFIRKVPTASGARAVQIVHKQGREVLGIEHIGSAHDEAQLAVLMEVARQRLLPGQDTFDLTSPAATSSSGSGAGARVAGMSSRLLWDVLAGAYQRLGFDVVGDETFKRLVLARIIEPTSKADTIRVLDEIGMAAPGLRTIFRSLGRCMDRDYRGQIAKACMARIAAGGPVAMVMYDVTTLHFEAEKEDQLRRVGMSKEHRVDPQVQVGLLVDPSGFPPATIVRRNVTSKAKSATQVAMYKSPKKCPGMDLEPGTRRGHPNPCATPLYTWKIHVITSANGSPSRLS
jgi:hypothetical protein